MRDFFRSPLFRCLVCLILVCCVLVNVSPIRADAFAGGAALTAVVGSAAAVAVVASAIHALGVMPDSTDTSFFEGVVNDCVSALTASGVFLNGMTTVLQLSDGVAVKNHVNQDIIQAILDWLFAEEIVSEVSVPDGYGLYNGYQYKLLPEWDMVSYPYAAIYKGSVYSWLYCTSSPGYIDTSNYNYLVISGSNYLNTQYYTKGWGSTEVWDITGDSVRLSTPIWTNYDLYDQNGNLYLSASAPVVAGSIGVASGLIAGQIGADIKTDYETWVEEGVVAVDFGIGYVDDPNTHNDDEEDGDDDTGTEIGPTVPPGELDPPSPDTQVAPSPSPSPWWKNNKWLNIGGGIVGWELGKVTRYLLDQTQTDVQTGTADPQYKPDTSLFGNGGNGNNTVVDPDPPTSDPSDPTIPSDPSVPSDIAGYTFSLNKIFPFCIPFDLYDFLTCLDATPVAPVINWQIQLPGGSTYPLTVDLSTFDSVAQLLRRLELLVFSIALAIKTRDLIKG